MQYLRYRKTRKVRSRRTFENNANENDDGTTSFNQTISKLLPQAATIEIISLTTEPKINGLNATISLIVVNFFIGGIGYMCSKFAL
ncbi:427_t:CDS:1, partial [Funneliformis geosporum]